MGYVKFDTEWTQHRAIWRLSSVPLEPFHVEHVVPLARGGADNWENLNIAHPSCNLAKGTRLLDELPAT